MFHHTNYNSQRTNLIYNRSYRDRLANNINIDATLINTNLSDTMHVRGYTENDTNLDHNRTCYYVITILMMKLYFHVMVLSVWYFISNAHIYLRSYWIRLITSVYMMFPVMMMINKDIASQGNKRWIYLVFLLVMLYTWH